MSLIGLDSQSHPGFVCHNLMAKKKKKQGDEERKDGTSKTAGVTNGHSGASMASALDSALEPDHSATKLPKKTYEKELLRLQVELVKLAAWVKEKGLRMVVLFEGRDAAGKGGAIQRITEAISPRLCRIAALSAPTEREKTQWYFQRYIAHLPAAGEIVLFDRSWYNRAGVERVMGFCSDAEYEEFMRAAPEFERMLMRAGIVVVKYWFSVSDDVQEQRFQERNESPIKRWKLSPMDLESRERWVEYSKAKDEMFKHTDLPDSPWWVVQADNKRRARLNCLAHLLSRVEYKDLTPEPIKMAKRSKHTEYERPPITEQRFVPEAVT